MRILLCLCLLALVAGAAEPPLGTTIVHPVDGALMVYVPAGPFRMGLDPAEATEIARQLGYPSYEEAWLWEAFPAHQVTLDGFFIDKYEVTVARWRRFQAANPEFKLRRNEMAQHWEHPLGQVFPVATIHWDEAQQYANWATKQLPTEAQWEKAARGTDGRFWPWGNTFAWDRGHFRRESHGGWDKQAIYTRVGRYPAGAAPCGALDLIGNQYELTREWLAPASL